MLVTRRYARDDPDGRSSRDWLVYIASALAFIPGVGSAAVWLRHVGHDPADMVLAAVPFVAGLLPYAARDREQSIMIRASAAGLLLSYAVLQVTSIGFLIIPAALLMGVAALRAFLR